VPLGRPGRTEPDLIFFPRGEAPGGLFCGVIELKRPDQRIATIVRNNAAILTRDAQTAVVQAQQYAEMLPDLIGTEIPGPHLFLGNNRYLFVIMGMSTDLIFQPGQELYFEMVNRRLPGNLRILPYDYVLRNFEQQYERMLVLVPLTSPAIRPIRLRAEPIDALSVRAVERMLRRRDFYDRRRNWSGKGLRHDYEQVEREGETLVIDRATGLMWQRSGSEKGIYLPADEEMLRYIRAVNAARFAGFNDWRLPTLEEAMSLVESAPASSRLHVAPVFDAQQTAVWTADGWLGRPTDQYGQDVPGWWCVNFREGSCDVTYPDYDGPSGGPGWCHYRMTRSL
jgi:hypothetical protein